MYISCIVYNLEILYFCSTFVQPKRKEYFCHTGNGWRIQFTYVGRMFFFVET